MHVSILLPTFKRPDLLRETLNSMAALDSEDLQWEVLVIDNANDAEARHVSEEFQNEIPLRFFVEEKRGKNNALNRGLAETKGELILFTDDDVLPESDWLIQMWEGAKRWPGYHVFGGRCLPKFPTDGKMPFEHPFFEGAYTIADWDIPEGPYSAGKVWGPNMAVRAAIFAAGWQFNPELGPDGTDVCILGDETDFTCRLEKVGYEAVYLPGSVVFHQIQRERMGFPWLFRRAFSFGREDAFIEMAEERKTSVVRGVPLYLMMRYAKAALLFAFSSFSNDERVRFDRGIKYWHTKGMIFQYRKRVFGKPTGAPGKFSSSLE